ncbi:MAG: response regulator [Ktedonobacteraceae bacterium]|nr:response regulator [Ktedonobacteraceae bacterium]MBO0791684.1 response regulator [Ktedonobacteraceae bacterium]
MVRQEEQSKAGERSAVKTVLLVEDDTSIGEVLVQAITQETPYMALLVGDGFEALNIVKGIKPHLFILDYQLPRMNGIELYDHLHNMQSLESIPAIMMSARLPYRELDRRNILGMNKPIDLDEFLLAIDNLLA